MEPSDDDLVAGAARGDRDAFAALYRRRRPDVYRFALHMTGNAHAAEDIAQDVFMVVIRDAARYVPGRSGVVPWLLGIARNYVRRRGGERRAEALPDERDAQALVVEAGQIDAIGRAQQAVRLRVALIALPRVYREAVVLCDLQELTYADAAAALGCAIGTIRSRLHRGRTLLADALRDDARGPARWAAPKWIL